MLSFFLFFFPFCWCFSTRRHDHLSLERGKAETLRRNITRGCLSGTLSHGTYQATFRTRSIFVMRVDSRARPSDVGRESTTFKAEQRIGYIIQNVGTNQQASLDPRTRFNGRCFIVEPVGCLHLNDWFHWGRRGEGSHRFHGLSMPSLFVFRTFSTLRNCRKTRLSFHTETHREDFSFIGDKRSLGDRYPLLSSLRNKCQHLSTKSLSSIDS